MSMIKFEYRNMTIWQNILERDRCIGIPHQVILLVEYSILSRSQIVCDEPDYPSQRWLLIPLEEHMEVKVSFEGDFFHMDNIFSKNSQYE